jgi:hypothetical protein
MYYGSDGPIVYFKMLSKSKMQAYYRRGHSIVTCVFFKCFKDIIIHIITF